MFSEITQPERIIFDGHPAMIGSLQRFGLVVITLGIAAAYFWIKVRNTHYLITSQRIVVEEGWLSKKIHTVEIYLIDDIELEKPFGQRVMGTGNILLLTQDKTTPRLHLSRLPLDVRKLYEQLRPAIEEAKYIHRIRGRDD